MTTLLSAATTGTRQAILSAPGETGARYYQHAAYKPDHAAYGFFTSEGGVSTNTTATVKNDKGEDVTVTSAFASLNVGVATEDNKAAIAANIRIAYEKACTDAGKLIDGAKLFINETTYSNKVLTITDENIAELAAANAYAAGSGFEHLNSFCTRIKADGFVSKSQNVILATVSADAHSIVLMDEASGVIGIMAGSWKGLAKGLYENVVESMVALGAQRGNIVTIIGPGLAKDNYEFTSHNVIDPANPKTLDNNSGVFFDPRASQVELNADGTPKAGGDAYIARPEYAQFFAVKADKPGNCTVDVRGLVACKAAALGLNPGNVLDVEIDTATDRSVFGARFAAKRELGAPAPASHKVLTGRNFNFVSLATRGNDTEIGR